MKIKLLIGMALISMALTGCGQNKSSQEPVYQKVKVNNEIQNVTMNLSKMPENLDPQFNKEGEESLIINNLYEGLMRQVGDELVNGMAQSYTVSEDGLTYTFTLRTAYWSDGEEVTARDFEYAWRRGADPLTGSSHLRDYEAAKIKNAGAIARGEMSTAALGVLALDANVLEVTLEEPNEAFLDEMALESFMPLREDAADEAGQWSETNAVYNGPFKLANIDDKGISLEKNENYWNAEYVNLQKINMKLMGDLKNSENEYLKNELDILVSRVNYVDTANIVLTPKAVEENGQTEGESQGKKETEESQEESKSQKEAADEKSNNAEILVHSWVSGWRINLQGLIWLGNAYVEEH